MSRVWDVTVALPDEAGWAVDLFGAQYSTLMRFLLARLRHPQDAEDLAQEAFLRLLRVPQIDLIRKPDAYLFRIAINLLTEFRMRSGRGTVVFNSEAAQKAEDGAHGSTPTEVLVEADHLQWVLEQLPVRCRTALILHRCEGLTYAQIAERLGVSPNTVKKYLSAGVARCRLAFEEEKS